MYEDCFGTGWQSDLGSLLRFSITNNALERMLEEICSLKDSLEKAWKEKRRTVEKVAMVSENIFCTGNRMLLEIAILKASWRGLREK